MDETKIPGETVGDDISGLLQESLRDRRVRDAAETETIDRAYKKHIFRARPKKVGSGWLTEEFVRQVHTDMFGEIWAWAGKYRTRPTNIGIDWYQIPESVKNLCEDFKVWETEKKRMPVLEIAARLQNRLTRIHPFQNGNGRHARLITDIFFWSCQMSLPQWPQIQLMKQGNKIRAQYIAAMKKADQEDYKELIQFISSCCK